jgi:phosphatidylglycerol:prolipoprotein diacylglycerol transferase
MLKNSPQAHRKGDATMMDGLLVAATVPGAWWTYPVIDPVWFTIPLPGLDRELPIRWYSLSYLVGIIGGWWLLGKMLAGPGAPLTKADLDDFILYAVLGVILGGRIGHILFYGFPEYMHDPARMLRIWEGGMSFHGGMLGVTLAIIYLAWAKGRDWLRIHDYVCVVTPIGLGLGRLANFVNGELYGRPTTGPWAMVFPRDPDQLPRHPSQLYQAALEGVALFAILYGLFALTAARYRRGLLVGCFLFFYGVFRFIVEFARQPDAQLTEYAASVGITMGQTLCLPMIAGGLWFIVRALRRPPVPA